MSALTERILELACTIQQIPAPTFHEQQRAEFIHRQFQELGLCDVETDDIGNVYARRPGQGNAAPVLVTAHTDTVFPAHTPLTLTRSAARIHGPGIGDNALGVAGLFGVAWMLAETKAPGDVWLAANVGEEGLGNLRGMRRVVERLGDRVKATIVLEGMALGHIYHNGIGVRRYRFTAIAEGGHSWLNFGRTSAIHLLLRFGADLTQLSVPERPKTTYNIGTVSGGTSINTIAREASLDLDLRSETPEALEELDLQVQALYHVHRRTAEAVGAQLIRQCIGDRPSGRLPRDHVLVQIAAQALEAVGLTPIFDAGSTDANLPLSQQRPCICIGLTHGNNAHRPDEYIETGPLAQGLQALRDTVLGALEHVR
ncbi:MAG: M20/M25/M40 family metallo-hydrolase [Anaerolineales bacterium]|nr:M20/M25/M40 family metallo-hydrolase [Anaerolineales bacterium]